MARVYLTTNADRYDSSNETGSDELRRLEKLSKEDRHGVHSLVEDPDSADLIIFVDTKYPNMTDVMASWMYKKYCEKVFVVHHGDKIFPFIPGVYVCPERNNYWSARQRTGVYLNIVEDSEIESGEIDCPSYLYSFVGRSETHPVRNKICALDSQQAYILDTSVSGLSMGKKDYISVIEKSMFVLCPRGYGSSSYRLFEALKMGRIPVIISDSWAPPLGPDWTQCSVRISEAQVLEIPRILKDLKPEVPNMMLNAKLTWDIWFSRSVIFHQIVEWCVQIQRSRMVPERIARYYYWSNRIARALADKLTLSDRF